MSELLEASPGAVDQGDDLPGVPDSHSVRSASGTGYGTGPEEFADPDTVEELRQKYRGLSKKSLYFLAKAVLGYRDITVRTHWEYAKFIQDLRNKRTIDLLPRGTFKTSVGTIAFCIWLLINNPNLFILIVSQTAGLAERMLLEIEAHLDGSNAMMNWLFPELIRPNLRYQPWSSEKMTVPNRTVLSGTPSIMALGVGGKAESLHFHVIIKDDLIGRAAMTSTLVMQEAIAWDDFSEPLFVSPSQDIERVHGTRWAINDLYSYKLTDPHYKQFIRQAIDEEGNLFFPERVTAEFLRELRDRNYLSFMSQYQNNPLSPENLDFRKEWLVMYQLGYDNDKDEYFCHVDGVDFWVSDMTVHLIVDPASSGDLDMNIGEALKRGRVVKANNAVVILGAHPSGRWFILDIWAGRGQGINPELQVAEKMLEMVLRWRGYVRKGWVEAFGAEGGLITVFNMLCKDRNYSFPMEKIPRGQKKAKPIRIRSLIGPVAGSGNLCCRPTHDQFILEFSEFPQSLTFDTLDAVAWGLNQIPKPLNSARREAAREEKVKQKERRRRSIGNAGY